MPKLRHFALASAAPIAAAEFYKEAFGMKEVARAGDPTKPRGAWGVHLSDGTVNLGTANRLGWARIWEEKARTAFGSANGPRK